MRLSPVIAVCLGRLGCCSGPRNELRVPRVLGVYFSARDQPMEVKDFLMSSTRRRKCRNDRRTATDRGIGTARTAPASSRPGSRKNLPHDAIRLLPDVVLTVWCPDIT